MSLPTPRRRTIAWIAVLIVSGTSCDTKTAGDHPGPGISPPDLALPLAVDLDGDGSMDTVSVSPSSTGGQYLVITRKVGTDSFPAAAEERLKLIAAEDLNADGTVDLLFSSIEESSISPLVLLIQQHRVIVSKPRPGTRYQDIEYRLDVGEGNCLELLEPVLHRAESGMPRRFAVAVGEHEYAGTCHSPVRRDVWVQDTFLVW